eukprot:CAMPEP_0184862650 /NCGR_PEP_ID=MMETSP0580-20130426/7080_1 /TAXON_ID=1118495 /ORGANISM="Dactyliosolen fragilissimus" /LENGTH=293 /DNA_ID=CAMNT_0027360603 /DNA_START=95 /DNA_END=976 /DNA_ORIENTATION=-
MKPLKATKPTNIPSKAVLWSTDKITHNIRRKTLAEFICCIPDTRCWWYRLPHFNTSGSRPERIGTDEMMPQLGHVFGLEEEAMTIALYEMGLLGFNDKRGTYMMKSGWEDLKSLFKIESNMVEFEQTKVTFCNGKRKNVWFIRMGNCKFYPIMIIKKKILPPTKLISRESSSFVCQEIMEIYKRSDKLELLFNTSSYKDSPQQANSNVTSSGARENEHDENNNSTNSTAEFDAFKKKFPLISSFNLPHQNKDVMASLLRELIAHQKIGASSTIHKNAFVLKNPTNPSYSNVYV